MSQINSRQISFLKKYQPQTFDDFDQEHYHIDLIKMFIEMNSLNLLIIGNNGSERTTLIDTIIREYYKLKELPHDNILHINNVDEQGIRYYRNTVKTFCQTTSNIPGKKKMLILDDIDMINDQSQQVFRNFHRT